MNTIFEMQNADVAKEWIETDGFGGFASGTASGIRTRRYHALLLAATEPPAGRMVLVNGFDAWIETADGRFELSSQHYAPDVVGGEGAKCIERFNVNPWPRWIFKFIDGTRIEQEIYVARESQVTQLRWRVIGQRKSVRLFVRPFLSGRDYHSLHKENASFRFEANVEGERVTWHPYAAVPAVVALSNGFYRHEPLWYRNFRYAEEAARGLDDTEDLAAPGVFTFDLATDDAVLILTISGSPALERKRDLSTVKFADVIRINEELRRGEFSSRLHRAADDYIVSGRNGKTIIAGYPWFTDWGRDTFIALRGLCLATGRIAEAKEILLGWADSVSEGMLPNRFPDRGQNPEYNSVDASLWFVIAAHELLQMANSSGIVTAEEKRALQNAVEQILEGYSRGTRYGIRMDADGLLACGVPGTQLTWMDAKIGDWVVTPRIGKPVEIQALWLNALKIAAQFSTGWQKHLEHGLKSFQLKFWNAERGCLFDVVDADHQPGMNDATMRPNQIFAVGGLPFQIVRGDKAERIAAAVEASLLTPLGLRSLASNEQDYKPRYEGGVWQRDSSYHQGTVWPWLIGPFVEAWIRVRGATDESKRLARDRFVAPMLERLDAAGLGHLSEIADAEEPHVLRGCPFQAWSLGELLRLEHVALVKSKPTRKRIRELATA